MTRIVYKLADAAAQVSLSENYLRQAIRSTGGPGMIPPLRARKSSAKGRDYLILHTDLQAWAESLPEA